MDKALKQRLVGASVLIILAVIILPMLLSGRSDRLKHESSLIELPPKPDELSIEKRRFPVGIPNKPSPTVEQETDDKQAPVQSEEIDLATANVETQVPDPQQENAIAQDQAPQLNVDDTQSVEKESVDAQAQQDTTEKAQTVTSITLTSGKEKSLELPEAVEGLEDTPRYLVQVASFSNEKNANALAGLLKAEDLPVLMDVADRPAGRMYRVRVGPYAKRPDADAIVSSLSTKMTDLNPRVLDLRPQDSAPVSNPSDPLVRWVVQVGSFSKSQSAEDLVARLRLAGLSAYSEKISSASGTVYKVRIGPELDRDKAAQMARKVKNEHQLDAFVTTQE